MCKNDHAGNCAGSASLREFNACLLNALKDVTDELEQLHAHHYADCEGGCPAKAYIKEARRLLARGYGLPEDGEPQPLRYEEVLDAVLTTPAPPTSGLS